VDYWDAVEVRRHATLAEFEAAWTGGRVWCYSAHAATPYTRVRYEDGDGLLFGGEPFGLPEAVRARYADRLLCIPMPAGRVRSLNLATAVGIVLYEALRQVRAW
jgi:tRNA (cytidine/uridine-2'-O-)-methyltransferase